MANKLHIISFDIPLPADYGGVIDVFYKLKSLSEAGIEVTLHCFTSSTRKENADLNAYCKEIFYYPRLEGWKGVRWGLPYIVSSRINKTLLRNLLLDEEPILFEGIHTTYWAHAPELKHRKKILRAHNIEHHYYAHLFKNENNLFRKSYFGIESFLLKRFEDNLAVFDLILPISEKEMDYFKEKNNKVRWLPAFHPHEAVQSELGYGEYCLYHGNLSVSENEEAAVYLMKEVFQDLNIPLIVAGKNPSSRIFAFESSYIQIIANPEPNTMEDLIRNAHIHVLPSFQSSGVKLKLLHALYAGRFCLTNTMMLEGSGISTSVIRAETKEDFKNQVRHYMSLAFTEKDIQARKNGLKHYDKIGNIDLIIH